MRQMKNKKHQKMETKMEKKEKKKRRKEKWLLSSPSAPRRRCRDCLLGVRVLLKSATSQLEADLEAVRDPVIRTRSGEGRCTTLQIRAGGVDAL